MSDDSDDKEIDELSYHDLLVCQMTIMWMVRIIFVLGLVSSAFSAEFILSTSKDTWIGLVCAAVALLFLCIIVPLLTLLKKVNSTINRKFGGIREE